MLNAKNIGLLITDADGRVAWVNQELETYLGITREQIIGCEHGDFLRTHVGNILADAAPLERLLGTPRSEQHVHLHIRRGRARKERWIEYWSLPVAAADAPARERIEYYADITAQVSQQATGPTPSV